MFQAVLPLDDSLALQVVEQALQIARECSQVSREILTIYVQNLPRLVDAEAFSHG